MDFAGDRRPSTGKIVGIIAVLLLHVFLIYALVSGLATSAVEMIKKPLEIKIIKATPPPPPPPPKVVLPPPPPLAAPPPPYVPPPLIHIQAPPQTVFAITTTKKPTAPPATAPAAPNTNVGVVCPNVVQIAGNLSRLFGRISQETGVNRANVTVEVTISPTGQVSSPRIVSSSSGAMNDLAIRGAAQLNCKGQGQAVNVMVPFEFRSSN